MYAAHGKVIFSPANFDEPCNLTSISHTSHTTNWFESIIVVFSNPDKSDIVGSQTPKHSTTCPAFDTIVDFQQVFDSLVRYVQVFNMHDRTKLPSPFYQHL